MIETYNFKDWFRVNYGGGLLEKESSEEGLSGLIKQEIPKELPRDEAIRKASSKVAKLLRVCDFCYLSEPEIRGDFVVCEVRFF